MAPRDKRDELRELMKRLRSIEREMPDKKGKDDDAPGAHGKQDRFMHVKSQIARRLKRIKARAASARSCRPRTSATSRSRSSRRSATSCTGCAARLKKCATGTRRK